MKDYYFQEDAVGDLLVLEDYDGSSRRFPYSVEGATLTLQLDKGLNVVITTKKINTGNLPALQDDFHFTIDALKQANDGK